VDANLAQVSEGDTALSGRSDEIGTLTQTFGAMLKSIREDIGTKHEAQRSMSITIKDGVLPRKGPEP